MTITERLRQLSVAVADQNWREFSMRVPVEPDRDADIVIMQAAMLIESRDVEVDDLLKQNVMLCMYLSQIAWGNTAKQQSAWAEEALNKTKELSKLILCGKDHIAITKNDSEVEFFHIVPHKTLLYRAITDIRKVL